MADKFFFVNSIIENKIYNKYKCIIWLHLLQIPIIQTVFFCLYMYVNVQRKSSIARINHACDIFSRTNLIHTKKNSRNILLHQQIKKLNYILYIIFLCTP